MTQAQWDEHSGHMKDDVKWPATKADILATCSGEDVSPEVMEDLKMNLQEGTTYNSADEVKAALVS